MEPPTAKAPAATRQRRFRTLRNPQGKFKNPKLLACVLLGIALLGMYGLLGFAWRVVVGKDAPSLGAAIGAYFNFLPAGFGGSSWRSGTTSVEAAAALEVLTRLSNASDEEDELEKAEHISYLQRLLEEQKEKEAKEKQRKTPQNQRGSGGNAQVPLAVREALVQLRQESVGDSQMLASLDRIQAVLQGRDPYDGDDKLLSDSQLEELVAAIEKEDSVGEKT